VVQNFKSDVETFEGCRNLSFKTQLSNANSEASPVDRRAMIAMPTHAGVLGGCPDHDEESVPVEHSFTHEAGEAVTYEE
jgi:hypothetical protein